MAASEVTFGGRWAACPVRRGDGLDVRVSDGELEVRVDERGLELLRQVVKLLGEALEEGRS